MRSIHGIIWVGNVLSTVFKFRTGLKGTDDVKRTLAVSGSSYMGKLPWKYASQCKGKWTPKCSQLEKYGLQFSIGLFGNCSLNPEKNIYTTCTVLFKSTFKNFESLSHLELGGIRSAESWDGAGWDEFPFRLLTNVLFMPPSMMIWDNKLSNSFDDLIPATIWLFLMKQNGLRRLRQITGSPINEQKISQLAAWLAGWAWVGWLFL